MGFHATIFVYGQTGSGKTFTMEGYRYAKGHKDVLVPQINRKTAVLKAETEAQLNQDGASARVSMDEEGIMPRAIRELFIQVDKKKAETSGKSRISVKVQYI